MPIWAWVENSMYILVDTTLVLKPVPVLIFQINKSVTNINS